MIKYILPLAIVITLAGCNKVKLNTVSYLYAKCESNGNVGIKLDNDGVYRCIKPEHKVKQIFRTVPKVKKKIILSSCPTTITEIFTSKATGDKPLITCKGKILEPGQNTRITRVNK